MVNRWLFVCTGCNKKYNNQCCFTKYKYDPKKAQDKANINLVNSRKDIDITDEEFQKLDKIVKDGVDNKLIAIIIILNPTALKKH